MRVADTPTRCAAYGISMDTLLRDRDLGLTRAVEELAFQQPVPEPSVEALSVTIFQGDPGSILAVLAQTAAIQSRAFCAMNSGPLSD